MLASHDSRLIEATECELWVCGETDKATAAENNIEGIRLEAGGMEAYRKKVCREIDEAAAKAEAEAKRKAAARVEARERKKRQRQRSKN